MMLHAFSREASAYIINIFINFLNSSKSWKKLQKKSIVATEATMTTL